MEIAATVATLLLVAIWAFQIALAAGAPWGVAAWGGQNKGVLPTRLRLSSGIAAASIYPLITLYVLVSAEVLAVDWLPGTGKIVMWALVGFFALGTVANLASRSKIERIWGPVCLLIALCCWIIARGLDSGTDPEAAGTDPVAAPVERVATAWERYVVVLPFKNLGSNEDLALVAGLTEEIRSRISALPSVRVISADKRALDVLRDPGLAHPDVERYFDLILEGSIRWAAGEEIQTEIRIVERGWEPGVWNREWTDPRSVEALLATQSEIAGEVRRILDLPDPDVGSPQRTHSIEAYEAYLRGLSLEPHAGASDIDESSDLELAREELAAAALEMPEDARTLAALGLAHCDRGELEPCEERWKQAFRLSPNADLAFRLGTVTERLGDADRARRWFDYANHLGHRE